MEMKKKLWKPLYMLAMLCLTFLGLMLARPMTAEAGGDALLIKVRVYSDTGSMSVGQNKKASISASTGNNYTLESKANSPLSSKKYYYYEDLDFWCDGGDLSNLPPVGTVFTLTSVDLPDGYELNHCSLPMTVTFTEEILEEMKAEFAKGEQVLKELVFNVYVRKTGEKTDISYASASYDQDNLYYTGKAQSWNGKLTYHGETLTEGVDYTVKCSNNVNAGTATAVVTGIGEYTGTKTVTYRIYPIWINDHSYTIAKIEDQVFTGKAIEPAVTLTVDGVKLKQGTDFTVEYYYNDEPGTAEIEIIGTGNYAGYVDTEFKIIEQTSNNNGNTGTNNESTTTNGTSTSNGSNTTNSGSTTTNGSAGSNSSSTTNSGSSTKNNSSTSSSKTNTASLPAKGSKIVVGKATYKVTKSSKTNGTVTYVAPKSTKNKSVTVPATIKYKGYTFKVTAIASKAFKNNKKLTTVTIGKNVTSIGSYCFYGDSKLKTIKITGTKLKTVGKNAFKGIYKKATIKVPASSYTAYKKLLAGKGQGKKVKIKK